MSPLLYLGLLDPELHAKIQALEGTVGQLRMQLAQLQAAGAVGVIVVDGLATLRGTAPVGSLEPVYFLRYGDVAADGLGGGWQWDSDSSATADGYSVITPDGHVGNGRWIKFL